MFERQIGAAILKADPPTPPKQCSAQQHRPLPIKMPPSRAFGIAYFYAPRLIFNSLWLLSSAPQFLTHNLKRVPKSFQIQLKLVFHGRRPLLTCHRRPKTLPCVVHATKIVTIHLSRLGGGGRGSKIFAHLASSQKLSELCAGCNRAKLFPAAGARNREQGAGSRVAGQGAGLR